MPIQIGQRPDHDFDEPLGLLSDCHRRIEHFLGVLVAVADAGGGRTLQPAHRTALEGALKYFTNAAPLHTADEEASLFPRLREHRDPDAAQALALVEALEHDHEDAGAHHAAVDALMRRWLADDRLAPADAAELRDHLTQLKALYQRHITIEDQQLFPAAQRVLDPAEIREIGREMASRRNLPPRG